MTKPLAIGIIGSSHKAVMLAQDCALRGLQVRVYDTLKNNIKAAISRLEWSLESVEKPSLIKNIEMVQSYEKLSGADIIAEIDETDGRLELIEKLIKTASTDCIVAMSCGLKPVTEDINSFSAPERVFGAKFHHPAKLVELARTEFTSDCALELFAEFLRGLGKTPVIIYDTPGLISERLRRPFILSALSLLELGKGLPRQIDNAIRSIGEFPLGPFEMADTIGVDHCFHSGEVLSRALPNAARLAPSKIEQRLAQYGQTGVKTGVGFYIYENKEKAGINPVLKDIVSYLGINPAQDDRIFFDVLKSVIGEAKLLVKEGVVSEFDVDIAVKIAFGWPKGPFAFSREAGNVIDADRASDKYQWGDAI